MDRLERLVNLVAALIDTSRPLGRSDIAARIEGYSSDPDAFRRNFERDKDLLRQMGFPLVTEIPEGGGPEDAGYRIPRELYELPDPGLDESELAALRLAASAVQMEGEWSEALVRALRKLGGATGDSAVAPVPGSGNTTLPSEEAAAVVFGAVTERRQVRFRYRGEERLVDPWRLSFHRGHWYLAGLDHTRAEERLFRLDRVDGEVSAVGSVGAFARPGVTQALPPPPWRMGDDEEQLVRIRIDAEQAGWAGQELGPSAGREEQPDGSVVFEVAVTNPDAFRSFVLGYLDHAEILAPPERREDLVAWLEGIR